MSLNVCTFTGNLGKDCRVGNVGGTAVCNFTVAGKSGFGDKEQTLWLDCELWGRQAESKLPQYLTKGQQVAVSGELGTRQHEGKTYLTLRVASISLVGGKREDSPAAVAPQAQSAPDDFERDVPF
jgi:single-strand DNA-binding protein